MLLWIQHKLWVPYNAQNLQTRWLKQVSEGELRSMEFGQTNITLPTSQYLKKCPLPLKHDQIKFTILLLLESSRVIIVILRALKIRVSNTGRENCNAKIYLEVRHPRCVGSITKKLCITCTVKHNYNSSQMKHQLDATTWCRVTDVTPTRSIPSLAFSSGPNKEMRWLTYNDVSKVLYLFPKYCIIDKNHTYKPQQYTHPS